MRSVLAIMVLALASPSQEVPDWAKHEYAAPAGQVYAAALKSIQVQKHDVQASNEKALTVDFHVGMTAWSWGYNMRLTVTAISDGRSKVTIGVLKSGGSALSWGSGDKEVRKIFAGIDAELASSGAQHAPVSTTTEHSQCALVVNSEPAGADVELGGKFVGNTPLTLRLPPGDYVITVKKAGYKLWTRTVTALPDNELTITAELEKTQWRFTSRAG